MRYHKDKSINLFSAQDRLHDLTRMGDCLCELSKHIDFEFFRSTLESGLYASYDASVGGRPPFDPVMMFKVLVLQRLYNLSDDAIEFQIKDRLSFMRFLGLDFGGVVPDAKTVWYFREQLQKQGLVKKLFDEMNSSLEKRGVIANKGQMVDATIVEAPRQHNSRKENKQIKKGEVPHWEENKQRQKDTDARWTKKHGKSYFGYKDHVIADRKSKLIKDFTVTPASVHDSQQLKDLTDKGQAQNQTLYADSAYRSAQIESELAGKGVKSRIHFKAARNRPLTEQQKESNKSRSHFRARVEHIFGFMENTMGGTFVRACDIARNETHIGMMNITYNLCRIKQLNKFLRAV